MNDRQIRFFSWIRPIGAVLLGCVMAPAQITLGAPAPDGIDPVDFDSQIRPILSGKCFQCHGPDESSRKAELRLDLQSEATKDRDGSRAIVPGDSSASELISRITTSDPDDIMPPEKIGKPVTQEEVAILKRWIDQGAQYATFWAFVPPKREPIPQVHDLDWPRNPIDFFVLERLEKNRLRPSPQSDPHALLRRLSLDLTGLPPAPDDADAFAKDPSPMAYERWVDKLLASPAYGERWARVWLDLARYADSAGYGSDPLRLNIWPWRDWLIDALNRNIPFDRFTVEMLAGDLLPKPTQEQLIATAFNRNTMTNTEGGTDDEEFRVAAVKDRANTTAQVWMGLTVGCAQCHSHKFDPISQREYYQFFALFNQTEDNDNPDERPTLPLPTKAQREKMATLKAEIADLEAQRKATTPELEKDLANWEAAQAKGIDWTLLKPFEAKSSGGALLAQLPDSSILAGGPLPETDTYTVKVRTDLANITAFRLEALTEPGLPNSGPGRHPDSGDFVLTELQVAVRSPQAEVPRARFVRVELPGIHRVLSLAEVQVFGTHGNVARISTASQSTTDAGAEASRAIDGNTDGHFDAGSTSMTEAQDDPWWELDLGSEIPIEEIVVWNRTDNGLGTRLADFKLFALDANRKTVWERAVGPAPIPATSFRLPEEKSVKLQNASASHSAKEFDISKAIDGSTDSKSGWSISEQTGRAHVASFELESDAIKEPGSLLIFTLVQKHGTNQMLGHFRFAATTQPRPVRELPEDLQRLLAIDPSERTEEQRSRLLDSIRDFAPSLADANERLKQLRKELAEIKPVALPILRELAADKQRETRLLHKGNFLEPGDPVTPGVLEAFHSFPENAPTNRLGLAQWLVSRDNPLTARVAVNRLWARLFGTGIVETEEDFGTQGSLPTHRELLDWLAVEFMDCGWDTKAMLKLIVMSAAYQQSSRATPELLETDPLNRLYSRGPRSRLDAEMVRDQALALSGLLTRKIGGPSVYPPQPDGLWRAAFNGQRTWPTSKGQDRYRRGIYTFWRRTVPYPSMATFDAPSREVCTVRRQPTNTPLQAFVTLNDPAFVESAQALGRRIIFEGGQTVADRIRFALRLCLVRPPDNREVAALTELYESELAHYSENNDAALKLATDPLGPLPDGIDASEAAAWTSVANVLLNLDGVLTKG